jgi:hypothetical protein
MVTPARESNDRSPDTVTFTMTQPTTFVVKIRLRTPQTVTHDGTLSEYRSILETTFERISGLGEGYVVGEEPDDATLVCIDLWAEGEHVVTYSGDYEEEIPVLDADFIVDAAIAAGIFVPALDERT